MADKTFRIKIARGDVQFEAEGDKAFVLEMLKRFGRLSPASGGDTLAPARRRVSQGQDLTAREVSGSLAPAEFIREFKFRQHPDLVLAFAYYLEQAKGLREFTPADINRLYYEAKIEPSNISAACIRNVKRGFMMEAKATKKRAKKRYMLTRSGENHVESNRVA